MYVYWRKMEWNHLWVCEWEKERERDLCGAVSCVRLRFLGVCALHFLFVWVLWAWALSKRLLPQTSFPRCPTFSANLLLTLATNLSQRSVLGGIGDVSPLTTAEEMQLVAKWWGTQSQKSFLYHALVLACALTHNPYTPKHTIPQWYGLHKSIDLRCLNQ